MAEPLPVGVAPDGHEDLLAMIDLVVRLRRAEGILQGRALEVSGTTESHRLLGKAQGVALAISYAEEALRG